MSDDAIPASSLDTFVELSSVLTGYPREVLAPPFDQVDLKSLYYQTARDAQGAVFGQLLEVFAQIAATTPAGLWPAAVQARILAVPRLRPAARQLIKLWFVGIWYEPPEQVDQGRVVSMQAYLGGLIWDTIQAHPMGFSQLQFGYWGSPPPPPAPSISGPKAGAA